MEMKKGPLYAITAIVLAAVVFCAGTGIYTAHAMQSLRAEVLEETSDETREDDVTIMDEYTIVSTLPISDAYKSGDSSKLSDREKQVLDMASNVLDEIITKDTKTDYDKELAVYDWMTSHINYDSGVLQVIPDTQVDADNPYGVLKYHNAVCVGYATTFRLLMQMLDINCMVVHNTEKYHSWNLVQLDGDWYHVDVYSDQDSANYANFNMTDDQATLNHDWDREFFPAATGTKYSYAALHSQDFSLDDIYKIPAMVRDTVSGDGTPLYLQFAEIKEAQAQVVEAMLSGIVEVLSQNDLGWMYWSWLPMDKGFILCIYPEVTSDDSDSLNDLDEETRTKIETAISEAFGEDFTLGDENYDEYDGASAETVIGNGGEVVTTTSDIAPAVG